MRTTLALLLLSALWLPPARAQSDFIIGYHETAAGYMPAVRAIYAELGMQPEFRLVPPERSLVSTNLGEFDADMARVASVLSTYPNIVLTNETLLDNAIHAIARTDSSLVLQQPDDVRGLRTGILRGVKIAEDYAEQEALGSAVANSFEALMQMLESGRIELALITNPQLYRYREQVDAVGKQVGPVLYTAPTYHALHRRHAALVPRIDAVMRAMKADGRMQQLLPFE